MQGDQVLGSVLFTPEFCRSSITNTLQNAPSSGVSTEGVLYLQSTGYIPSVQIHTKSVRAAASMPLHVLFLKMYTSPKCGRCTNYAIYSKMCTRPNNVIIYNMWYIAHSMVQASQVMPVVNNPPANAGDARDKGSVPGLGRSPGRGHGNPLQDSCLENPVDRGAWWATVHRVAEELDMTQQLNDNNQLGNKTIKQLHINL